MLLPLWRSCTGFCLASGESQDVIIDQPIDLFLVFFLLLSVEEADCSSLLVCQKLSSFGWEKRVGKLLEIVATCDSLVCVYVCVQ